MPRMIKISGRYNHFCSWLTKEKKGLLLVLSETQSMFSERADNNNNNNNNNNYYYYYLLRLGCHPVAVVILHV